MTLVEILAKKMYKYCGGTIELEELISYGHIGLIDSVDKFNYKKGIKFVTYATYRIRGTMLDNVRTLDWVPRTLKKKSNDLVKAKDRLSSRKSNYTMEELIEESGLTLEEIRKIEMVVPEDVKSEFLNKYEGTLAEEAALQAFTESASNYRKELKKEIIFFNFDLSK